MSLDVSLWVTKPTEVFSTNITHNLGRMADKVQLGCVHRGYNSSSTLTLYQVLWRPEEVLVHRARELIPLLEAGYQELRARPEHYSQWNPENGWGTYHSLCSFVQEYLLACRENPDAEIEVCR